MKQRKKIETLKLRFPKQLCAIRNILIAISCIVIFAGGYNFATDFIGKKMTDTEFKMYEQVAHDFYGQIGNTVLIEIPEGVAIEKTDTYIRVYPEDEKGRYEGILAKQHNGKLVCERYTNI